MAVANPAPVVVVGATARRDALAAFEGARVALRVAKAVTVRSHVQINEPSSGGRDGEHTTSAFLAPSKFMLRFERRVQLISGPAGSWAVELRPCLEPIPPPPLEGLRTGFERSFANGVRRVRKYGYAFREVRTATQTTFRFKARFVWRGDRTMDFVVAYVFDDRGRVRYTRAAGRSVDGHAWELSSVKWRYDFDERFLVPPEDQLCARGLQATPENTTGVIDGQARR